MVRVSLVVETSEKIFSAAEVIFLVFLAESFRGRSTRLN